MRKYICTADVTMVMAMHNAHAHGHAHAHVDLPDSSPGCDKEGDTAHPSLQGHTDQPYASYYSPVLKHNLLEQEVLQSR